MLLSITSALTALSLLVIPRTISSLPTSSNDASYMCGYVLTEHNSSTYAGLSAFGYCESFFYNKTIHDWQDAFAWKLFGGCQCRFYGSMDACAHSMDEQDVVEGEGEFPDPRPKWYKCDRRN